MRFKNAFQFELQNKITLNYGEKVIKTCSQINSNSIMIRNRDISFHYPNRRSEIHYQTDCRGKRNSSKSKRGLRTNKNWNVSFFFKEYRLTLIDAQQQPNHNTEHAEECFSSDKVPEIITEFGLSHLC